MSVTRETLRPAKPRKPRIKACEVCSDPYEVRRLGQRVCGDYKCAIQLGKIIAQAAMLKKARKEKREWKQSNKKISKLIAEAQHEFNRFIRERDFGQPCICCGKYGTADPLSGGLYDAGHFRTRGAAPHLRFNEDNCHLQLKSCNMGNAGKGSNYRQRLIEKIGLERVEALENDNRVVKWDRDQLIALRRKYLGMWKALKAEREAKCLT